MVKDEFKLAIANLQCDSSDNKLFITTASLKVLMTPDWIRNVLRHYLDLEKFNHQIPHLASLINEKGRIVFAILIQTENVDLLGVMGHAWNLLDDGKLPWDEVKCLEVLEKAAGDGVGPAQQRLKQAADDIYREQWVFLPPMFSPTVLHQDFEDKRILPFIGPSESLGKGGSGEVFTLRIHPECQSHLSLQVDHFPDKLVRKQMTGAHTVQSHKSELDALGILHILSHNNILKLLGSYTYKNTRNLILPFVENGNLQGMLLGERESPFLCKDDFLSAFVGLASAIHHLHNYEVDTRLPGGQKIQRKGYHHDLHPRNILISETTFILADFGTSTFKLQNEDSNTDRRARGSDFLAPEYGDLMDESERPEGIRRSAEIWSYGCILVEILVFMHGGAARVKAFRRARRQDTTIGYLKSAAFYCGGNSINPIVDEYLEDLKRSSANTSLPQPEPLLSLKLLLALIRDILCIEQQKRPNARMVMCRLSSIALFEISAAISAQFLQPRSDGESLTLGAEMERIRFECWRYALHLFEDTAIVGIRHDFRFEDARGTLLQLQEALAGIPLLLSPVRLLIDQLWTMLKVGEKERAEAHLDEQLLVRGDDKLDESSENAFIDSRRKVLLKIKRMTDRFEELEYNAQHSFVIDQRTIHTEGQSGEHRIGIIQQQGSGQSPAVPQRVLIEWREPTSVHLGENNAEGQKFVDYTRRLSELLGIRKPMSFHALPFRGFIRRRNSRMDLVFNFPAGDLKLVTLEDLILQCKKPSLHPFLEDKFRLAHALAEAVYDMHQVGWLHKRLRPSNIIFFTPSNSDISKSAEKIILTPYIVGFSHSRPNERDPYTELPLDPRNHYSHPDYIQKGSGFRQEFDYYSLGLILLEIGQWHSVSKGSVKKEHMTAVQRRDEVLQDRLHILPRTMGKTYHEAVKTCLDNDWAFNGKSFDSDHNQKVRESFHRLVVCRLQDAFRGLSGADGDATPA